MGTPILRWYSFKRISLPAAKLYVSKQKQHKPSQTSFGNERFLPLVFPL